MGDSNLVQFNQDARGSFLVSVAITTIWFALGEAVDVNVTTCLRIGSFSIFIRAGLSSFIVIYNKEVKYTSKTFHFMQQKIDVWKSRFSVLQA